MKHVSVTVLGSLVVTMTLVVPVFSVEPMWSLFRPCVNLSLFSDLRFDHEADLMTLSCF